MCNHVFPNPECAQRREWEANAPPCKQDVTHKKPCGHRKKMKCWQAAEEQTSPTTCLKDVDMSRPRCTHALSLRCAAKVELAERWASNSGMAAARSVPHDPSTVTVEFGTVYGPSEQTLAAGLCSIPKCNVNVRFRMECGHIVPNVPCNQAFDWAAGVDSNSPFHRVSHPITHGCTSIFFFIFLRLPFPSKLTPRNESFHYPYFDLSLSLTTRSRRVGSMQNYG